MNAFELSERQKLKVATMALERIKDAPLLENEKEKTISDALHLINWGTYDPTSHLGDWGKVALKVVTGL
jgi:hypothetical protein